MQKFEKFLHHLADLLDVDLSVELWSGEVIPLCRRPTSDLALRIADPGVIASLLRSPRMLTFISLLASGRLRLVNGTLFEFEPRRQEITAKLRNGGWRRIDKRLMLSALAPFLMMSGKASIDDQAYKGESRGARDDKALVQFHYDLSNDFYALFLDPLMVYSCAYFPTFEASLEEAQRAKLDIICRKLRLKPGEKFLDIGCGWGGLVIHAAQNYGVIAHGATLSQKQFDYAKARIAALGLEDRVKIELADFREFEGPYDKIASVGMFEHVGEKNLEDYFAKVFSLLKRARALSASCDHAPLAPRKSLSAHADHPRGQQIHLSRRLARPDRQHYRFAREARVRRARRRKSCASTMR